VNEMDGDLDKYSEEIRKLAVKNKLPLCDLRKIVTTYDLEHNPEDLYKGILTTDGVHMNDLGNKTLADTLLPFVK